MSTLADDAPHLQLAEGGVDLAERRNRPRAAAVGDPTAPAKHTRDSGGSSPGSSTGTAPFSLSDRRSNSWARPTSPPPPLPNRAHPSAYAARSDSWNVHRVDTARG